MFSKRSILTKVAVAFALCVVVSAVSTKKVEADTTAKTQQGVVLKTSELKVDKVIVSPKPTPVATTSRTSGGSNNSSNTTQASRGVSETSSQVVNYSYNFLGKPYVYGASGPNAFDCSGFTSYVYRQYGVSLPRTSQSQFGAGYAVSRGNLAPGDLVFFNTVGPLGHVGMYIGGGDFIHAASSGRVKVSSLNEGYYSSRYAGARRVM